MILNYVLSNIPGVRNWPEGIPVGYQLDLGTAYTFRLARTGSFLLDSI